MTGTVDVTVTGASPTLLGTPAADTLTASGAGALVFAGGGNDTITANGAKSTIYGGTGTNTITLHGAHETVALQQGGTDQISGFKLHGGDVLDLSPALAEAGINLGGDFSTLCNYVKVASSGSDATLSLTPTAQVGGSGASLAVLHGVGSGVTLSMLISDHALNIS